jgi:hypothetical protein
MASVSGPIRFYFFVEKKKKESYVLHPFTTPMTYNGMFNSGPALLKIIVIETLFEIHYGFRKFIRKSD